MAALLAEPTLTGVQVPRILWTPPGRSSTLGPHAVKWARECLGLELDPWEQLVLDHMLAKRADGRWVAFEAALIVARQNGKSLVLMIRELYGLFVLGERRIVHTAHLGDTSLEAYWLTRDAVENSPDLEPLVSAMPLATGREGIELRSGCKLRFKTRTKSGGRGLGGDLVALDEAQELLDEQIQALSPVLAARSVTGNPQLLYAGSAGQHHSTVLARVRRRGLAGDDPRLLFIEHSIDDDVFLAADPDTRIAMSEDPAQWALANPAMGARISEEYLAGQLRMLGPIGFAREHMGVGSWPIDDATDWLIPRAKWSACADANSAPPVGSVALAVGASWDRTVSIAVCGARADGMVYAELTHYGPDSTPRIVAEVQRMVRAHSVCAVVVDPGGPAGPLTDPLQAAGVELSELSAREVAHACGGLFDAATAAVPDFRHRGQPEVTAALAGARRKNVGDGWVLDRRRSATDVTPFEVLALARWGFVKFGRKTYEVAGSVW